MEEVDPDNEASDEPGVELVEVVVFCVVLVVVADGEEALVSVDRRGDIDGLLRGVGALDELGDSDGCASFAAMEAGVATSYTSRTY